MNLVVTTWLPGKLLADGTREPASPCPELLTADEAVRYLRLDEIGTNEPARALTHYREQGLLKGRRVGKCVRYLRKDLDSFIESTEA